MPPTPSQLDTILALQLTVAWAGEKAADPQRLAWWDTDLIDAQAGGDLFARLCPRTAAWAGFELARLAAMRVDAEARSRLADPDSARTLFHFGFEVDVALDDRLAYQKRHAASPLEALGEPLTIADSWDRAAFEQCLRRLGTPAVEDSPAGRQLQKSAESPDEAARVLAAALLPLSDRYPVPYVPMKK